MRTHFTLLCLALVFNGKACSSLLAEAAPVPSFTRIDAHTHVFTVSPELMALLERNRIRILNICVVDKHDKGYEEVLPQHASALEVVRTSKGRAAWCATFDPQDWDAASFATSAIQQLDKAFSDGALAVKIYKNIGMELRTKEGKYIMPDDPAFHPILEAIAARNKTVFAHLAEPSSSWRPLDPASPSYGYLKSHPDWHMFMHPERPKKEAIMAARDHLLELHPKLRVVGCHLGSIEEDVDELGLCLDKHPNFAVDTAARIHYLMLQPREKVREFLIKYQDRVLYGSDLGMMPWHKLEDTLKKWNDLYERDWKFLATDEEVEYRGAKARGLALPEAVLRKLFHDNAVHWVPGLRHTP
jgi:predicted TIM-barrel fold metal-dependent hydrolase